MRIANGNFTHYSCRHPGIIEYLKTTFKDILTHKEQNPWIIHQYIAMYRGLWISRERPTLASEFVDRSKPPSEHGPPFFNK